jgi:hypothetical protein
MRASQETADEDGGVYVTDLDDASPVAGEDELALTPLVAHALVDCDGSDALCIVFAVAHIFV